MSDVPFDDDLKAVSRAYREASGADAPSPVLDDLIRTAARREAAARPPAGSKAPATRWYVPLAAAAVVVLSVTVTLMSVREKPELVSSIETAAPADLAAPAGTSPGLLAQADAIRNERSQQPVPAPSALPAPRAATHAAPSSAQNAATPALSSAQARENDAEFSVLARPAPPPATDSHAAAGSGASADMPAPASAIQKRQSTMSSNADAAAWLRGIELQQQQGHVAQARLSLARFREAYPHHPVPEELARSLRQSEPVTH